jgi:uncharacterized protein (DUF2147 family)
MLHCPRNTMRTIAYTGIFLATGLSSALAADPTGDWKVADGVANIRVAECYGNMWGAVSWEKTPGGRDINNPDVSKQSRPSLAMAILLDMKKEPSLDQWKGQVYNAKDGQLYSSTIRPVGPDTLEIRGCVLGFLCGGENWTRVAAPIPSSPANSMAKGSPKAGAPKTAASAATGAPKTTGSVTPAAKPAARKLAAGQPGDIGDICLLPEIAGFAH